MKKNIWNRILSLVLTLVLVLSCLPGTALPVSAAEAVSYIEYSWDGSQLTSQTKSVTDYTVLSKDSSTFLSNGWYVVSGNLWLNDYISVSGTVNLILMDGAVLTVTEGIRVGDGDTLNIFAQSNGSNMGKLISGRRDFELCKEYCGIGSWNNYSIYNQGGEEIGNINIHGGNFTLKGAVYHSALGAGNNIADNHSNYVINIYSGNLTCVPYSANYRTYGIYAPYGTLNIYGGEISTQGSYYAAIYGKNLNIYGGNVTATRSGDEGTVVGGTNITVRGGNLSAAAPDTATDGTNGVTQQKIYLNGASNGEKILALYNENMEKIPLRHQ